MFFRMTRTLGHFIFATLLCLQVASAGELTAGIQMVNVSFSENKSDLTSTSTDVEATAPKETASGSVPVTALNLKYEMPFTSATSFFGSATVPATGGGNAVFYVGGGMNFYLQSLSSKMKVSDEGTKLTIRPVWRYYAGFMGNMGYLVYSSKTAKKSDVLFEIGVQGGAIYNFKPKWGARGELGIGKGTGVATSTTAMKVLVATTYDFME